MGFLEDLFGQLGAARPPIDVFGGQGLDAFGELMGDGSDALQPITPFGPSGGFLGGLGSLTSSSPSFWQMPQLGGDLGGFGQTTLPIRTGIQPRGARALTATPTDTFTPSRPGLFSKKPPAQTTTPGTATTPGATPTGQASATTLPTFTGQPGQGTRDTVLRWLPLVREMSQKYGVPEEVILASIDSESGGDPGAIGPEVPGQGRAHGLLQAMDSYWGKFGDLHDPRTNLDVVVGKLMAPAWQKYKSAAHVRAVTYGGPGAIDSNGQIKGYLADAAPAMGGWTIAKDVQRYLPKVAAYQAYLQAQQGQGQAAAAPPPQAANGPADLADLWAWLGGSRQPITGRFGEQDGPYPGSGHRGMDIGTPLGTRLTSPVEGVVMAAGDVGGGYGNQVRIKTAYGSVLLGHLSSVNVQPGQQVTPGMMLGLTGSTGRSTGPHVHIELRDQQDNPIDPARYYRW